MELQLPKGTRDFPPEEKGLRDDVLRRMTSLFERYGFQPLETPAFERWDVLSAKYAGGEEILRETFRFRDQGERELALRYDLTVPLARFVAMNPQLKMPFKRYAVGKVWRDGPIKLGRYREFYQCDVDTVGSTSMLAEAECLRLGVAVFRALGIEARYVVNDRNLLEALLSGVPEEKMLDAMLTLDKLRKVGLDEVKRELREKAIPEEPVERVMALQALGEEERLAKARELAGDACAGLEELFGYLKGLPVVFEPVLSRGLAYYTGTVFEAFAEGRVTSSLSGGGRYDELIGALVGKGAYPAVGISFGLEPILDVLTEQGLEARPTTRLYVAPIKAAAECVAITERFREAGVATEMDLKGRSISKNLDYADARAIPFVLIVGKKELEAGVVKLRDMATGTEEELSVDEAVARLGSAADPES